MSGYTKGPWHVESCKDHAPDDFAPCRAVRDESGAVVPRTLDNLRLQAAAPALLEALNETWDVFGGVDHHIDDCPEDGECIQCRCGAKVNAAIRAAEGGHE